MPRKQPSEKTPPTETSPALPDAATDPEPPLIKPCPIAGFGASAGGLEAFTEVLRTFPADSGVAIIFVQHLDPKHSSVLAELLGHVTSMPVLQITEGVSVEPDHVYVIPPNTNVRLSKGMLQVEPRLPSVPHMPIDRFFRSLAEEQGGKAVGVVLSGTASDGTLGLKAIKGEGGITFAQSPESAKYDGMPRSAIAAGCVDFVLPPEAISQELDRICRHPYLVRQSPAEAIGEFDTEFNEIYALLRTTTGVDFSYYKPGTIRRRTLRRMALLKMESPAQYVRHLKDNRPELDLLFQDLLINVTGFFREPETFTAIRTQLLPKMLKDRSPEDVFRVWVPGCSTGEEVYSVAITILEYLREHHVEVPIQVFGTDLSEAALQRARAGAYPESIVTDVTPERLRRYFTHSEDGYRIVRLVRDICVFARQNVTKDPPFSKLDLITCRNLLIYLGPVLQSRVMRLFHYALRPDGFLVLGASEHIGNTGDRLFEPLSKHHRIYARKIAPPSVPDFGGYDDLSRPEVPRARPALTATESQTRVDRMILARYSPPALVLSRSLKVLQFRGDTTPYLEHATGEASLELAKLARAGMGPEIRRLVEKAETALGPIRSEPITLAHDNEVRTIRISVTRVPGLDEPQFLTVFEEIATEEPRQRQSNGSGEQSGDNGKVHDLEQELASTRHYLQSVIEEQEASTEELQSAHEEVQSSNEELQSTNEELLTAKEELQSTNEELTTVNEEMQSRNAELQQTNNDLLNLLSSANIPILMLSNDLRIRRFTPHAKRILNLIPADLGRPISDFRLKVNVPDLVPLCQEVIDTLASREREVQDAEGRAYAMSLRPYRTLDNRIEGVVLSLSDITERKRSAEARYRRLFEAAKDAIIIVDGVSGEIVDANPFVTKLFEYTRAQLLGVKFWKAELFHDTEIDESILAETQEQEFVQRSLTLCNASGESIETEIVASLYVEGDRKVVQFNIRDIRARRRNEEKLQRSEIQVRQSQSMEALGRLAAGIAHDFNNVLTTMLGYTDLLQMELHDSRSLPMLQEVRTGAERLTAMTKRLLTYGRRLGGNPVVLNAVEVISDMRPMITAILSDQVNLTLSLPSDAAFVRIDRTQLEQIVLNLVLNSRDGVSGTGGVTVEMAVADVDEPAPEQHPKIPKGRYVCITVKDTGNAANQEAPSPASESAVSGKSKTGGAEIGLSTVYNNVRQSGGYIRSSGTGLGGTISVYFPRVEPPDEAVQPASPREERAPTETVLLVDYQAPVRTLARRFLEMRGYQVLEAANGPDALQLAREHSGPIHILVTDVVMPRMSGRELAFQLAPERPEMKVLYTSGHTKDVIVHHGVFEKGINLLEKPFTQDALAARVREVLDRTNGAGGEEPVQ